MTTCTDARFAKYKPKTFMGISVLYTEQNLESHIPRTFSAYTVHKLNDMQVYLTKGLQSGSDENKNGTLLCPNNRLEPPEQFADELKPAKDTILLLNLKYMLSFEFLTECYEKYKLDWMILNNYSLNDLMTDIDENMNDKYKTYRSTKDQFEVWQKNGFSGELWVCQSEFEQTEFQNPEYMSRILWNSDDIRYYNTLFSKHPISNN